MPLDSVKTGFVSLIFKSCWKDLTHLLRKMFHNLFKWWAPPKLWANNSFTLMHFNFPCTIFTQVLVLLKSSFLKVQSYIYIFRIAEITDRASTVAEVKYNFLDFFLLPHLILVVIKLRRMIFNSNSIVLVFRNSRT